MSGTRFEVRFFSMPCHASPNASWLCVDGHASYRPRAWIRRCFMIAPNVGESPKAPFHNGFGCGELSRVVLALKSHIWRPPTWWERLSLTRWMPGIGGAVGRRGGKKSWTHCLKSHQLICITHLPQIARYGDHHYYIRKQVKKGRTITSIRPMDTEANESKRSLACWVGKTSPPTALEHARNLVATRPNALCRYLTINGKC